MEYADLQKSLDRCLIVCRILSCQTDSSKPMLHRYRKWSEGPRRDIELYFLDSCPQQIYEGAVICGRQISLVCLGWACHLNMMVTPFDGRLQKPPWANAGQLYALCYGIISYANKPVFNEYMMFINRKKWLQKGITYRLAVVLRRTSGYNPYHADIADTIREQPSACTVPFWKLSPVDVWVSPETYQEPRKGTRILWTTAHVTSRTGSN